MKNTNIIAEKVIGSKAKIRILSFLYNFSELDYSISRIADECEMTWNTARKNLQEFEELGLVKETRKERKQTFYKATNKDIMKSFVDFENKITNLPRGENEQNKQKRNH